jgi:hypothetical protein
MSQTDAGNCSCFCVFSSAFQPRDKAKLCPKSREPHQKEKDEKDKKRKRK